MYNELIVLFKIIYLYIIIILYIYIFQFYSISQIINARILFTDITVIIFSHSSYSSPLNFSTGNPCTRAFTYLSIRQSEEISSRSINHSPFSFCCFFCRFEQFIRTFIRNYNTYICGNKNGFEEFLKEILYEL